MWGKVLTILLILFALPMLGLAGDGYQSSPSSKSVVPVSFNIKHIKGDSWVNESWQVVPATYPEGPEEVKFNKATAVFPLGLANQEVAQIDPAVENELGLPPSVPDMLYSFPGVAANDPIPPFDCTIAVGPDDILVATNGGLAAYNREGDVLFQASLLAWFANVLPGALVFDPKIVYDPQPGHYILSCTAIRANECWIVISVSQGAQVGGNWRSYALDASLDGTTRTSNWADQPSLGFDGQAVYLTGNMFRGGVFQYMKIRILNKSTLYSGGTLTWVDLWDLRNPDTSQTKAYSVKPVRIYGVPPTGVFYFINSTSPFNECNLTLWSLTNPLSPTPTLTRRLINVACYFLPPEAHQPGTSVRIETSDARVWDAVYRNGMIWATHNVAALWGELLVRSGIRWYQIEASTGRVVQQATFGAPGFYYLFGSILPDRAGNAVMVYNRCSRSEYVSSYYTGRLVNDPSGQLGPGQGIQLGAASYVRPDPQTGINRWGDYNGITLDPDDVTAWVYGAHVSAENTWGTWIAGLIYPGPDSSK